MSRYHSYLDTAKLILQLFEGKQPFLYFIKDFLRQNKKYGSRDRKMISELCYGYFRLGKALPDLHVEERIKIGIFLCSAKPNEALEFLEPDWNKLLDENEGLDPKTKITFIKNIYPGFNLFDIFPWSDELSKDINIEDFILSHLRQPDLFIRIRPGYKEQVLRKLQIADCRLQILGQDCLALPNASKIDSVLDLNKEAVVQDLSSQRIGEFFLLIQDLIAHPSIALRMGEPSFESAQDSKSKIANPRLNDSVGQVKSKITIWDACAGSGGKSILAKDIFGEIDLTVSDIRKSILVNLKKRFAEAGIKNYKSFVTDLTTSNQLRIAIGTATNNQQPTTSNFDFIIADFPCTGSGTWSRTPEQLAMFKAEDILRYSELQKKIVSNVIPHLAKDGFLLYSTCSVFKKENEEVVNYIIEKFQLRLVKMELLKGYDQKADTLFAALLIK